jgi:hypothetical protein
VRDERNEERRWQALPLLFEEERDFGGARILGAH